MSIITKHSIAYEQTLSKAVIGCQLARTMRSRRGWSRRSLALPAVCYGADPSSIFAEGKAAYDAHDYARARALYEQACIEGNVEGCSNLGFMFYAGQGGPQDDVRARELFNQACAEGNAKGCFRLGYVPTGKGGAQDVVRARELFDQGCKGDTPGGRERGAGRLAAQTWGSCLKG